VTPHLRLPVHPPRPRRRRHLQAHRVDIRLEENSQTGLLLSLPLKTTLSPAGNLGVLKKPFLAKMAEKNKTMEATLRTQITSQRVWAKSVVMLNAVNCRS